MMLAAARRGGGGKRVLLSTIAPISGGVPMMACFAADTLAAGGFAPLIAYYAPFRIDPELSVPGYRLLRQRVGMQQRRAFGRYPAYAIGAWFPELEFTHFAPTRHWQELIDASDYQIAASGNFLAALPLHCLAKRHLAWLASDWRGDRVDRVKQFPWYRKAFDRLAIRSIVPALERRVLRSGAVVATSEYTRRQLNLAAGREVARTALPVPVDTLRFQPRPDCVKPGLIAFVGRLDDPRKNIGLFIDAVGLCAPSPTPVSALLIGGQPRRDHLQRIQHLGLNDCIRIVPYATANELIGYLQSVDLFIVPSHQEGLCIAALEAMACGAPVVSTPCGGPQEFVMDDETGVTVEADAAMMATSIMALVNDRRRRARLSGNARSMVVARYAVEITTHRFWSLFSDACLQ